MLIQFILIAVFLLIFAYFLLNSSNMKVRAWKKIAFLIFAGVAIVAVLHPLLLTKIANFVGVGRGADLLLYLLTASFIFVILNIFIKFKKYEETIATLARKIAILESDKGEKK